jgi:Kyakuja-Dileera-Zisupton transposase
VFCQCVSWLPHNYACQCKNHPNVIEGVNLEDFETIERVFSSSNEVVGVTQNATGYRQQVFIDMHSQQWDEEKYRNLGTILFNNHHQALRIIEEDQVILNETLQARNLTVEDLDRWQDKQARYFKTLGQELAEDLHQIVYVDLLQQLHMAQ